MSNNLTNPSISLDRILGVSTLSNSTLASFPTNESVQFDDNGEVYYAAGCVTVRYSAADNKQIDFYTADKPVSCIATAYCSSIKTISQGVKKPDIRKELEEFLGDGSDDEDVRRYLAVGERGHNPSIIIWDIDSNQRVCELIGAHKHGIGSVCFSPNGKLLITIGFKYDKQLIIWDWRNNYNGQKLSVQKLGNKVNSISYHPSGEYFVTAGDRHLKVHLIIHAVIFKLCLY